MREHDGRRDGAHGTVSGSPEDLARAEARAWESAARALYAGTSGPPLDPTLILTALVRASGMTRGALIVLERGGPRTLAVRGLLGEGALGPLEALASGPRRPRSGFEFHARTAGSTTEIPLAGAAVALVLAPGGVEPAPLAYLDRPDPGPRPPLGVRRALELLTVAAARAARSPGRETSSAPRLSYPDAMRSHERFLVVEALALHDWNVTATARRLSVSRQHLHNLIRKHGLTRP